MPAIPSQMTPFGNPQMMNEQFMNAFKNMFPPNDQLFGAAQKMLPDNEVFFKTIQATLGIQAEFLHSLAAKLFDSTEKLVELNVSTARVSMNESVVLARKLLATNDPQESLSLVAALPQPTALKAMAYGRHLANIVFAAQVEVTRAMEDQAMETSRRLCAMLDEAAKAAPVGTDNTIGMMKSAITNAAAAYEQVAKTTKQAAETMETNVHVAADQAVHTAEKASRAASRGNK